MSFVKLSSLGKVQEKVLETFRNFFLKKRESLIKDSLFLSR
jgi:hypothetical protein